MTSKEFIEWCNLRACDGRWDLLTALICGNVCKIIWCAKRRKREKMWDLLNMIFDIEIEIVIPINKKIEKLEREQK